MDISYEESQLILRALKGHATRMLKIAESENMIAHVDKANTAATESKMAKALAEKFEVAGVRMS